MFSVPVLTLGLFVLADMVYLFKYEYLITCEYIFTLETVVKIHIYKFKTVQMRANTINNNNIELKGTDHINVHRIPRLALIIEVLGLVLP